MGSKKLEFSCVTADWGGTEGIGTLNISLRMITSVHVHNENHINN